MNPSGEALAINVFNIFTILDFGLLSVYVFNIPFLPIKEIVNLVLLVLLVLLLANFMCSFFNVVIP